MATSRKLEFQQTNHHSMPYMSQALLLDQLLCWHYSLVLGSPYIFCSKLCQHNVPEPSADTTTSTTVIESSGKTVSTGGVTHSYQVTMTTTSKHTVCIKKSKHCYIPYPTLSLPLRTFCYLPYPTVLLH